MSTFHDQVKCYFSLRRVPVISRSPRKRSGLLPARLERPREDLLKMIAVIDRRIKKNNVGTVFRPG